MTLKGDCIIGINASKSCADLSSEAKNWLQGEGNPSLIRFEVAGKTFDILARGSSRLTHTNEISMVIRRSDYACARTLAIRATASAIDLPRSMIMELKNEAKGSMKIYSVNEFFR